MQKREEEQAASYRGRGLGRDLGGGAPIHLLSPAKAEQTPAHSLPFLPSHSFPADSTKGRAGLHEPHPNHTID